MEKNAEINQNNSPKNSCPKTLAELKSLSKQQLIAIYQECMDEKVGQNEKFQKFYGCDYTYTEFKTVLEEAGCVYFKAGYYPEDFVSKNQTLTELATQQKSELEALQEKVRVLEAQLKASTTNDADELVIDSLDPDNRVKATIQIDSAAWEKWKTKMHKCPDKSAAISCALTHFVDVHFPDGEFVIKKVHKN